MALTDTEIVFIAVASCGAVLLAGFLACLLIFCCFRRKRSKERLRYREPSYKSRSGVPERRARYLDYHRRVFKPPLSSSGSSSYQKAIDNRSEKSEGIYSVPYETRILPPPYVDDRPLYRKRSFGFDPFSANSAKSIKSDQPSLNIKDNTVYIPYSPRFINLVPSERDYPSYPRLSIKELDDDVIDIDDDWKYPSTKDIVALPRYELDYL